MQQVETTIGLDCTEAIQASAKAGIGIKEILEVSPSLSPPEHACRTTVDRSRMWSRRYTHLMGELSRCGGKRHIVKFVGVVLASGSITLTLVACCSWRCRGLQAGLLPGDREHARRIAQVFANSMLRAFTAPLCAYDMLPG